MKRIETTYLGLKLKSPVMVGSSGMTASLQRIKQAEMAGAGAVVLKSIFEEQILSEVSHVESFSDYPETADYVRTYVSENRLGLYLNMIQEAKQQCSIPIIASIHCKSAGEWANYARVIETAGADALELNIFLLPTDKEEDAAVVEKRYLDTIAQVRAATTLPIAVKLGSGFTNPLAMVREIYYRNVQGVVLFNRFYPLDIDIERLAFQSGDIFSQPTELSNVLRWTGLINAALPLVDIAVSTGVHDGSSVVKAMLAGASSVQVVSAIYESDITIVGRMNDFLKEWMMRHNYNTTQEFVGRMNASKVDPVSYERTQFMKYFSNHG